MTYRLGAFHLDVKQHRLVGPREIHPLSETLFRILLLLVEARGAMVARETLVTEVWGGGFVADATINQHILRLRKLFREEPRATPYIVTEPGHGYRLDAEITPER
jgi:DNA-binding winged helix-turn-helix (wHTH) protein